MCMKACFADTHKKTVNIKTVSIPKPGDNEVLIKIYGTAVNRADLLQKRGLYDPPKGVTGVLGLEAVGEVTTVGESVTKLIKGERVMALLAGGGYAEYTTVSEDHVFPIPEEMSYTEAAAIPEAWLTAFQLLFVVGQAKSGDTILVHAGASGVGTALIQLARLNDIKCFATAGTNEKVNFCLSLGAFRAFNYKEGPFAKQIVQATEGKGVDILLDCVGGSFFSQNSEVVSVDGQWVSYGVLDGTKVNGDVFQVVLRKRLTLVGSTLRNRSHEYKKELISRFVKEVMPYFSKKQLRPIINQVFPFEEINEAHDYVEANKNIGKVIIRVHN